MRLPGFQVIAKPVGPLCNLRCKYCFYLEKERLYPATTSWAMPDDVLESFIRQYIEAQGSPVITFAWQGGEPTLLGVDYFRRVVELEKKYSNGKRIENVFQTNGVLLDNAWGEFLARNRFLVGLSLDGPPELHDGCRVDGGGRPTFGAVRRGLDSLKRHGVEFNTLTVVHRRNSRRPLEVYRFLKEVGSAFMQFIPAVERLERDPGGRGPVLAGPFSRAETEVSEWSVEPLPFGEFLCAIFDEWVRRDVGRHFVQTFDVALESWLGRPQSLCVFSETCGAALALEHNGDVYPCDHYVYPESRLGNIGENPLAALAGSERQRRFGLAKRDGLPRYCRECEVRFACHGECPKHRFSRSPRGEEDLNYLCAGYKLFFTHIDPAMRYMAEELLHGRPPANVMDWMKRRDAEGVHSRVGDGQAKDPSP